MLKNLAKYINHHKLCRKSDRILVAVSGGIDSVVLLDLMVKSGYKCSIAHCNFQLRGGESEQEMEFVVSLGKRYGIRTFIKRFETSSYASQMGISTQMAARDLRYNWFSELAGKEGYDYVAIAHNADDNIETFFLNLVRGTGLAGISGMLPKSDILIRPLLWAGRDEIQIYSTQNKLEFMEDSSNAQINYKRNYLRHEILPGLDKLNPSFRETMGQNMEHLRQSESMLNSYYSLLKEDIVINPDNDHKLSLSALERLPEPAWFLHRYLSAYGFTPTQVTDITKSLRSIPGKKFLSNTHFILKDREYLILRKLAEDESPEYIISSGSGEISSPLDLIWETVEANDFIPDPSPEVASLNASKLKYPLRLRKWKAADSFYPLGMKTRKKLSDFFIDNKFSLIDKENTWLLVSGKDIVWIVGHRIDDRYKLTPETDKILKIEVSSTGSTTRRSPPPRG